MAIFLSMDSALVLLGLLAIALVAPPIAGGIVLGMTGKGLIDVGTTIAQAPDKQTVIRYVTSHPVRTLVVGSALVLMLIAFGFGNKVSQYRAFEDPLSPSEQLAFQDLSLGQQLALVDAASTSGASPGAIAFYLDQVSRPGSPLAELPMTDAMFVSALAEQSGKGALILDYIGRYGVTDALRIATPEVINGMANDHILVQTQEMLSQNTGYNVSPEQWLGKYPAIGRDGTFITDEAAIQRVIGDFNGSGKLQVTAAEATALEKALGLTVGSLQAQRAIQSPHFILTFLFQPNTLSPGWGVAAWLPQDGLSSYHWLNAIGNPYALKRWQDHHETSWWSFS